MWCLFIHSSAVRCKRELNNALSEVLDYVYELKSFSHLLARFNCLKIAWMLNLTRLETLHMIQKFKSFKFSKSGRFLWCNTDCITIPYYSVLASAPPRLLSQWGFLSQGMLLGIPIRLIIGSQRHAESSSGTETQTARWGSAPTKYIDIQHRPLYIGKRNINT